MPMVLLQRHRVVPFKMPLVWATAPPLVEVLDLPIYRQRMAELVVASHRTCWALAHRGRIALSIVFERDLEIVGVTSAKNAHGVIDRGPSRNLAGGMAPVLLPMVAAKRSNRNEPPNEGGIDGPHSNNPWE